MAIVNKRRRLLNYLYRESPEVRSIAENTYALIEKKKEEWKFRSAFSFFFKVAPWPTFARLTG